MNAIEKWRNVKRGVKYIFKRFGDNKLCLYKECHGG